MTLPGQLGESLGDAVAERDAGANGASTTYDTARYRSWRERVAALPRGAVVAAAENAWTIGHDGRELPFLAAPRF